MSPQLPGRYRRIDLHQTLWFAWRPVLIIDRTGLSATRVASHRSSVVAPLAAIRYALSLPKWGWFRSGVAWLRLSSMWIVSIYGTYPILYRLVFSLHLT
jgi:hypothetical protein